MREHAGSAGHGLADDFDLMVVVLRRMGVVGPRQRLLGVYLTAHSDPWSGEGLRECDRVLRDCGMPDQELSGVMSRLTDRGILEARLICPDSGDVHWTLAQGQR